MSLLCSQSNGAYKVLDRKQTLCNEINFNETNFLRQLND